VSTRFGGRARTYLRRRASQPGAARRGACRLPARSPDRSDDTRVLGKLGSTEVRLGFRKTGLARRAGALPSTPEGFEMHDRMIRAYLIVNQVPKAAAAAARLAIELPHAVSILRAVSIRAHMSSGRRPGKLSIGDCKYFSRINHCLKLGRNESRKQLPRGNIRFTAPQVFPRSKVCRAHNSGLPAMPAGKESMPSSPQSSREERAVRLEATADSRRPATRRLAGCP